MKRHKIRAVNHSEGSGSSEEEYTYSIQQRACDGTTPLVKIILNDTPIIALVDCYIPDFGEGS